MSSDLTNLFKGQSPPHASPITIPKLELNHHNFRPITKKNVGYIVCGLAFDDDGNVLMMQVRGKQTLGVFSAEDLVYPFDVGTDDCHLSMTGLHLQCVI